jgi:hypothetical protein
VHHLQGKAEGVTPPELQTLLREFYLERLALLMRHESSARFVSDYDVNNAYQNVINREGDQVSWLQHALLDMGLEIPADPAPPDVRPTRKGDDAVRELATDDARASQQFVDKWRARVDGVTNARHQGMLGVILGEMLEHQRLFAQAAEGRTDIIGTALAINVRRGKVIDRRWIE